jgi:hypothetical protein
VDILANALMLPKKTLDSFLAQICLVFSLVETQNQVGNSV